MIGYHLNIIRSSSIHITEIANLKEQKHCFDFISIIHLQMQYYLATPVDNFVLNLDPICLFNETPRNKLHNRKSVIFDVSG